MHAGVTILLGIVLVLSFPFGTLGENLHLLRQARRHVDVTFLEAALLSVGDYWSWWRISYPSPQHTLAAYANALVCVFRIFDVFCCVFIFYQLLRISSTLYILVRPIDFII